MLLLTVHVLKPLAPFACLKNGLFGFFFQPEQCFSLTTIQPEQYFSASFSQVSDQRTGPLSSSVATKVPVAMVKKRGDFRHGLLDRSNFFFSITNLSGLF